MDAISMDIALDFIEQLTNRVGIPVTIAIVFVWIAIRAYNFWEKKLDSHLTDQTKIMAGLVTAVESSAEATKTTVTVLDRICVMATHIEALQEANSRITSSEGDHDGKT